MRLWEPSLIDRQAERLRGHGRLLRQVAAYLGPGFLVTVGFIDPGNWATNVAAGAEYGYTLLWVVVLGTVILILWQHMAAHLGVVTGKCLAEAIRANARPWVSAIYGSTAMAAICATALAELLGAAIGLYGLFRIPIPAGAAIAATISTGLIVIQRYYTLEKVIVAFVGMIGLCYLAELHLIRPAPDWAAVARHMVWPQLSGGSTLVAVGVLGAVVMPHNMYLHSEIIQNRDWTGRSDAETRRLLQFEFVDTLLAMLTGLAINAAMIIVAASVFHSHGRHVDDLIQAEATLRPLAGNLASIIFGVGLVLAGISSSMTAAIAAGVTFTGYIGKDTRIESGWFRLGMISTVAAAYLVILAISDTFSALIISQVCLSMQLPLTMLPLWLLTSSKRVMGRYSNSWLENGLMVLTGLTVLSLNALLIAALL